MNLGDPVAKSTQTWTRPAPTTAWSGEVRALTVGLILTVTIVAFEALAVATITPRVAADLHGLGLYGWMFSAFFLGDLVGIVIAGQLVDRRGLVLPYVMGLLLFATGLLAGGLAPTMTFLVAGRAVQGVGAGAIPAVAYVAIGREYPAALRPRMLAYLSSAWVLPGLAGPALAGFVADLLGWRTVFLGLVPLVALAAVLTVPPLRRLSPGREAAAGANAPGANAPGATAPGIRRLWLALRVAVGSALVLAALGSREPVEAVVLAAGGLVLALPALLQLVPPGTLTGRPGLPATVLVRGVLTFAFTAAEAYLPLTLVTIRGTSASMAGLTLTAATIFWAAGAWIQARQPPGWGAKRFVRLGFALVAAGILTITAVLEPDVPVAVAVLGWGTAGLGMGLSYAPTTLIVLALAPEGEQGAATAGLQLSDVLGTALGAGVGGAVVAIAAASGWDPRFGLLAAFAIAAAVALGGVGLSRRLDEPAAAPSPAG